MFSVSFVLCALESGKSRTMCDHSFVPVFYSHEWFIPVFYSHEGYYLRMDGATVIHLCFYVMSQLVLHIVSSCKLIDCGLLVDRSQGISGPRLTILSKGCSSTLTLPSLCSQSIKFFSTIYRGVAMPLEAVIYKHYLIGLSLSNVSSAGATGIFLSVKYEI